jgi:hypothetical protein
MRREVNYLFPGFTPEGVPNEAFEPVFDEAAIRAGIVRVNLVNSTLPKGYRVEQRGSMWDVLHDGDFIACGFGSVDSAIDYVRDLEKILKGQEGGR